MHSIGIDCRFASGVGGLGTYTRGIVRALLERNDPWSMTLFVRSRDDSWLKTLPHSSKTFITEAPFSHYSFSEQFRFPAIIRDSGCDLFYSPHFIVPLSCPVPSVLTVHDLILHHFPNESGILKRLAYRFIFDRAVRSASAIVTVSESTKRELLQHYPETARNVTVSYPGIDAVMKRANDDEIRRIRQHYQFTKPFLLYVGNCKQHKNVPMLIEAFKQARLSNVDLVLVCGGKECSSLILPDGVRRILDVQESDFAPLYSAALGFVTATLAEGFGLPPVEAMACGTPVLATNRGSISEVCGEHATLVSPTVEALASGMKSIVTDVECKTAARLQAASEWAKRYDWTTSAARLATLLHEQLIHH